MVENQLVTQAGKKVQFQNGALYTDDQEVIEKLKSSGDFGVTLFEDTEIPQVPITPEVETPEGSGKKKKADAE